MKANEPLRIGIAGLGTVGSGLLQLLTQHGEAIAEKCGRPVAIAGVCARSREEPGAKLTSAPWFDAPVALAVSADIDVFVELMGGDRGPALESVKAALGAGKHVVTANKALLARHGAELAALAEKSGVSLNFEAAVAGGIPIVKTLRESLLGNPISRVYGILNGTSNYILTRMQREGLPFAEVLAEAQALGYAEADPTFDVDGQDAGHKLTLLAALAFGVRPNFGAVHLEGIRGITPADFRAADELGYRIKLLAVAAKTASGIEARVSPTMIPKSSALASVDGVLELRCRRGRFRGPDHARGARRRLAAHSLVGGKRHHRYRARTYGPALHPACGKARKPEPLPRCEPTKADITSGFPCTTGLAPSRQSRRAWRSSAFRSKASSRSARRPICRASAGRDKKASHPGCHDHAPHARRPASERAGLDREGWPCPGRAANDPH